MKNRIAMALPLHLGLLGLTIFAQTPATTSTAAPQNNQVHNRKENQQDRIAQGVQSGQLTAGETKNIEGSEANLNREVHADRSANGGKLTSAERAQVNRQQNRLSRQIHTDKTNASTAHYGNGPVGQRRENQQDRIASGIKNGSLTAGETAHLENREQGVNQQIRADRQVNGGRLTATERKQVNRSQNRASAAIYNKKHNAARQ